VKDKGLSKEKNGGEVDGVGGVRGGGGGGGGGF